MISQAEFSSRAALCRQLAKREPANGVFWIAEAENWSRLSKEKFRGEPRALIGSDVLGSRQAPRQHDQSRNAVSLNCGRDPRPLCGA